MLEKLSPIKFHSQISHQVEAQNQVVRKLEEKERLLQTNLMTVEKELAMRQQAMEMHKRYAFHTICIYVFSVGVMI